MEVEVFELLGVDVCNGGDRERADVDFWELEGRGEIVNLLGVDVCNGGDRERADVDFPDS